MTWLGCWNLDKWNSNVRFHIMQISPVLDPVLPMEAVKQASKCYSIVNGTESSVWTCYQVCSVRQHQILDRDCFEMTAF